MKKILTIIFSLIALSAVADMHLICEKENEKNHTQIYCIFDKEDERWGAMYLYVFIGSDLVVQPLKTGCRREDKDKENEIMELIWESHNKKVHTEVYCIFTSGLRVFSQERTGKIYMYKYYLDGDIKTLNVLPLLVPDSKSTAQSCKAKED